LQYIDIRISIPIGIAITGRRGSNNSIVADNILKNYSFITIPEDDNRLIARCITGLKATSNGTWYFNGTKIFYNRNNSCDDPPIQQHSTANDVSVVNLRRCGAFTIAEEGVYSCIALNSSMMNQTMKLGVYFSRRSKSTKYYACFFFITLLSFLLHSLSKN